MTQVATIDQPKRSVLMDMSRRYGMEPAAFEATLRATVVPKETSREQFAAFLLVAREYGLNPITKEIYAFPTKGGGIQPIVGIDGWFNLINSHPQCDGVEFDDLKDDKGALTAITCRIFRKDRSRPTSVTEYMNECKRPTDPWQKWPARMLRHKAAIQCARYAFGFAGIIDPEEAERSPDVITGRVAAPPPKVEPIRVVTANGNVVDAVSEVIDEAEIVTETGEATEAIQEGEPFDLDAFLTELDAAMATGKDENKILEIWDGFDVEATLTGDDDAMQRAFDLRAARLARLNLINAG